MGLIAVAGLLLALSDGALIGEIAAAESCAFMKSSAVECDIISA